MNPAKAAKLIVKLEEAEQAMFRAFNKWAKLRAQVRRADARLAKEREHVRASKPLGGKWSAADLMGDGPEVMQAALDSIGR